jgi:hypothetical protein
MMPTAAGAGPLAILEEDHSTFHPREHPYQLITVTLRHYDDRVGATGDPRGRGAGGSASYLLGTNIRTSQ